MAEIFFVNFSDPRIAVQLMHAGATPLWQWENFVNKLRLINSSIRNSHLDSIAWKLNFFRGPNMFFLDKTSSLFFDFTRARPLSSGTRVRAVLTREKASGIFGRWTLSGSRAGGVAGSEIRCRAALALGGRTGHLKIPLNGST